MNLAQSELTRGPTDAGKIATNERGRREKKNKDGEKNGRKRASKEFCSLKFKKDKHGLPGALAKPLTRVREVRVVESTGGGKHKKKSKREEKR